ncbi:hypothetical protein PGB90_000320 [Kerria lacca]
MTEFLESKKDEENRKIIHTYALVKASDMNDEMKAETIETCVTACEKYSSNNEAAARMIKETMDKKFGTAWHTVVGESYGFEISYDSRSLLYMFFGGNTAVCTWKCS